MLLVPVVAHEAGDEQLAAQAVLAGRRDGVVQEERVADRPVDDAVQDVCEEFALGRDWLATGYQTLDIGPRRLTTRFPLFLSASRAKLLW